MYHSITFGTKNTWEDWHLMPSSRPVFNPPSKKTVLVDIPGSDGILDLSEVLTGYPVYNNREGSFEFIVENGYKDWSVLYSEISDYLHGKTMKAVLEDDPNYYYEGLFSVNEWKSNSDGTWSNIVIDYNVKPYKFVNGITTLIYERGTYDISDSLKRMPVCPSFIVDSTDENGMTFQYTDPASSSEKTVTMTNGSHQYPEIVLTKINDNTKIVIGGSGRMTIKFQNGGL